MDSDWASGLVVGLLVFGCIFFISSIIAAIICYYRRNNRKNSPLKIEYFRNILNWQRKKFANSNFRTQSINKNGRHTKVVSSEDSNSTEISTISDHSDTVKYLQFSDDKSENFCEPRPASSTTFSTSSSTPHQLPSPSLLLPPYNQSTNTLSPSKNDDVTVNVTRDVTMSAVEEKIASNSPASSSSAGGGGSEDMTTVELRIKNGGQLQPPTSNTSPATKHDFIDPQNAKLEDGKKNNHMTLIRSKRASLMPMNSRAISILSEDNWNSTIDLAFEDLI